MPAKKTTKKPAKQSATRSKSATPAKRPATRKTASTKTAGPKLVRMAKRPQMESFKLARPQSPFLTIAITRQTLYWGIIAASVLGLGLWIIHLQNSVNEIYDQIDANRSANSSVVTPKAKTHTDK